MDGGSTLGDRRSGREERPAVSNDLRLALAVLGGEILLDNNFARRLEDVIHQDTMFFHSTFAMLLQQEVESFSKSTLTRGLEEIRFDVFVVGMSAPDDTERMKQVAIDMPSRWERFGQLRDRRSRHIRDTGGRTFQPRVGQDFRHLDIILIPGSGQGMNMVTYRNSLLDVYH